MDCVKERKALKEAHPDRAWIMKVNKMTDQEVIETFRRLKSQKKV